MSAAPVGAATLTNFLPKKMRNRQHFRMRTWNIMIFMAVLAMIAGALTAQQDSAFLLAPRLVRDPSGTETHAARYRKFTGIPSLSVSPEGRLWATWYAGKTPAEDQACVDLARCDGEIEGTCPSRIRVPESLGGARPLGQKWHQR